MNTLTQRPDSASPATATPAADAPHSTLASLQGKGFAAQSAAVKPNSNAQAKPQTLMQRAALSQDPNERERAILESDADAASGWVRAAAWAVGISTAYSQTRKDAGKSMYLGRADALRHCLWNGYMAFMLGEEKAKSLADAHELPGDQAKGDVAVDRGMDLHNNAVGRRLGATARSGNAITRALALSFIAAAAMSALNDGELQVVDQSQGAWRLIPSNTKNID